MRTKKIVTFILAVAMLLGILAGCTGTTQETEAPASTAPETTAEAAAQDTPEAQEPEAEAAESEVPQEPAYFPLEETETITFWTAYPPIGITPEEYLIYTEAQERLNVKLEFTSENLLTASEKFNLMIASNEYPDIINYFNNYYTSSAETAYEEEVVMDLTDIIDEYAPDYQRVRTATESLAEDTLDGGMVLEFYMIHSGERTADFGPAVRKDWLNDLGLEAPETYDDWHDVITAFKNSYGATMALPSTGTVQGSFLAAGYDITLPSYSSGVSDGFFMKDDEFHYGPYEDSLKDYLTMMHQWYEEGLIYPDFYSDTNGNSTTSGLITNSTCGLFWLSAAYITEYEAQMGMSDVILPISDAVKEEGQVTHMTSSDNSPMGSLVISTGCRDVELAVRFMNWWYTDEGTVLANYGVEGLTFEYGENGEILWGDLITNNSELSTDGALALYTASRDSMPYVYDDTKYDTLYAAVQVEAGKIWMNNDDGAYTLPSDFEFDKQEEALVLMGDIATYVSESVLQFIIGDRDLDEFDAYIENLKALGIEDVLEAYTNQYRESL